MRGGQLQSSLRRLAILLGVTVATIGLLVPSISAGASTPSSPQAPTVSSRHSVQGALRRTISD